MTKPAIREDLVTAEIGRAIIGQVKAADLHAYLLAFMRSSHWIEDKCYFSGWKGDRKVWHGELSVAIYRYLLDRGLVESRDGKHDSYYNPLEWMYQELTDAMVSEGLVRRLPILEFAYGDKICNYDLRWKRVYEVTWG